MGTELLVVYGAVYWAQFEYGMGYAELHPFMLSCWMFFFREQCFKKINFLRMKRKREEGPDERFVEITTKGVKIPPQNVKKYKGSISKIGNKWQTELHKKDGGRFTKTHDTLKAAESYIIDYNTEQNVPIKNMIYKYNDEYYCVLSKYQLMKFSFQDLNLVEENKWYADSSTCEYYAKTCGNGQYHWFYQKMFPQMLNNEKVKYLNDDFLDNTRENLLIVTVPKREKALPNERFLEITTKSEKIRPTQIDRYKGSVEKKRNTWYSLFRGKYKHIKSKPHDTQEEAEARIIKINIRENLHIKNVVYIYNGEYYCLLTQNQLMKFSPQDLDLIKTHIWYAAYEPPIKGYYARTNIDGGSKPFTHFIFTDLLPEESIDHISRVTLDNTRENLRIASASMQVINRNIQAKNKSGVTGVYYRKRSCAWVAIWNDEKKKSKSFPIKQYGNDIAFEMACKAREEAIKKLPKYQIALNLQV